MRAWKILEIEKRNRLLSQGVLPTTLTGADRTSIRGPNGTKTTPTFPHLLTPIGQPFRQYQGFFGKFLLKGNRGDYIYKDACDIGIQLSYLDPKNEKLFQNPLMQQRGHRKLIEQQDVYKLALSMFPKDEATNRYCFIIHDKCVYYIKKTQNEYTLYYGYTFRNDKSGYEPFLNQCKKNSYEFTYDYFLDQFVRETLNFDDKGVSAFYTEAEIFEADGIFMNAFNRTTINATYAAAFSSFIKKMEDNLNQLCRIHPYNMGSALINKDVASFFYHFLGMFHAAFSLLLDPIVELTALITRTAFAPKPEKASELYPAEWRSGKSNDAKGQAAVLEQIELDKGGDHYVKQSF